MDGCCLQQSPQEQKIRRNDRRCISRRKDRKGEIMSSKKISVLVVSLVAAVVMMTQSAVADQGRFYLVPGVQWMDFDSDRGLSDDWDFSLGWGYGVTDNVALELAATRMTMNADNLAGRDRLRQIRLDLIYNVSNEVGRLAPYFVAGMGDSNYRELNDEGFLNFGTGLSYRFNDRMSLRAGARTFYGVDSKAYDFGVETGLVIRLGPDRTTRTEPTPAPAVVEREPEPECPDVPPEYAVDERGCPIIIEEVARVEVEVQFEFDRYEVRPAYFAEIRQVADFLAEHPDVVAELGGHTCNIGTEEYNQGLSERRANAVRQVLINEFGVSPGRLTARGYGESQPIASNNTQDGRERNRRVESVLSTTVQRPLLEEEL